MTHPSRLSRYYRKAGATITLPTGGAFLNVDLPDGRLEVLPMSGADELTMTNTDLLMSGVAIEELIRSCAPSVGDPKMISMPDMDMIMIAIRAASYGDTMEVEAQCPKCNTEQTFDVDLDAMMADIKPITQEHTHVRLDDDLVVGVRPFNYGDATTIQLAAFVEQRKAQMVESDPSKTPEDVQRQFNQSILELNQLRTSLTSGAITKVIDGDEVITDRTEIAQFFENIPIQWSNTITKAIERLNEIGSDRGVEIKCASQSCGHIWKSKIEFDQSAFSAPAS